jgi:transposase InsO family protein
MSDCTWCTASIKENIYDVAIDSGSDPYSFISKDVVEAEGLMVMSEEKSRRGKYADSSEFKFKKFVYVNINLTSRKISKNIHIKCYVLRDLPVDVIIGNKDIHFNDLYQLLKDINTVKFETPVLPWAKDRTDIALRDLDKELDDMRISTNDVEHMDAILEEAEFDVEAVTKMLLMRQPTLGAYSEEKISLQGQLDELLHKYRGVFGEKVRINPAKVSPMQIKLKPGAAFDAPVFKGKMRKQPPDYLTVIEHQIKELVDLGIIRVSRSNNWSQIHLAKKPDGGLRFCIDYKALNAMTELEYQALPNIETIISFLNGSLWFAKMDLAAGFHQIEISEDSKKYTAFRGMMKTFEFNRCPFGLLNASHHFQYVMNEEVLEGLIGNGCFIYVDDVIIYGDDKTFIPNLENVLQRFQEFDIVVKKSKCEFLVEKIKYLGHTISGSGIEMSDDNKEVFEKILMPKTCTAMKSFLGLANYHRQFLSQNFAEEAHYLHELAKGSKNSLIKWTPAGERAFFRIKELVKTASKLHFIKGDGELRLYTDASLYAFGGYLAQEQLVQDESGEDVYREVPIYYFSKAFTKTQTKWSVSDKECYAIFYGLKFLHHLVANKKVKIFTDHRALAVAADSTISASPKILRMKQLISMYDTEFVYIRGADNVVADALSRCFNDEVGQDNLEGVSPDTFDIHLEETMEDLKIVNLLTFGKEITLKQKQQIITKSHSETHEELAKLLLALQGPEISPEVRAERLKFYHGALGHWGMENTIRRINDRGEHWAGYRRDVKNFINDCKFCMENKMAMRASSHIDPHSNSFDFPNEAWAMDLMEYAVDSRGYRYILVVIDLFHRWLTLIPLKTMSSDEVIHHLWYMFNAEGKPYYILSDEGSQLTSKKMEALLEFLEIHQIISAPRSHQQNAIAERVIGIVREQLQIKMREAQEEKKPVNWSTITPTIMRLHNIKEHSTTGVAPIHLRFNSFHNLGEVPSINTLEDLLERAKEGIQQSDEKRYYKNKYEKLKRKTLEAGITVWRSNPDFDKLNPTSIRRIGPYTLIEDDGNEALIEDMRGKRERIKKDELRIFIRRSTTDNSRSFTSTSAAGGGSASMDI